MKPLHAILLALTMVMPAGKMHAGEPPTTPFLRIEAGMHTAIIQRIAVDNSGRLILTASHDKTARLWDLPSGRLLRVLRPPLGEGNEGRLDACALNPDGTLAAVGGWTGYGWDNSMTVYIFDTATGRLIQRLPGLPEVVLDLAFSEEGHYLAAVLGAGKGLRVWETSSGREIGRDTDYGGSDSYGVDWHHEEHLVTSGVDGKLRLYQLENGRLKLTARQPAKVGNIPIGARFSPDGQRIAVGFDDATKIAVYDGTTLKFLFAPNVTGAENRKFYSVTWSRDGTNLAAGGMWVKQASEERPNMVRVWTKEGHGEPSDYEVSPHSIMDLRPMPGGGLLFATIDPMWGILNTDGDCRLRGQSPIADYAYAGDKFLVSRNGTTVGFDFEIFGKDPARFSISSRRLELGPPNKADNLRSPQLTGLKLTDWIDSYKPKLGGKLLALALHELSDSTAIAGDASTFLLGTDWYLHRFSASGKERWKEPAPGKTWTVNLADNDQLAVAGYGDGTIRWYRTEDGKELLAFFPHADKKRWVLWTPEGYYDCSPGAEDLIGWQVNRGKNHEADFFPASKFRDQFYRPDVIARVLETKDVAAAVKAADETAGRKAQPAPRIEEVVAKMQPPVVELAVGGARGEASVEVDASRFTVRYRVRRSGSEAVTQVRLLVDGRPADIDAPVPESDTAEASASVPLPPHDCVVTVLAQNRFAVSEPATLNVLRQGAPPAPPTAEAASSVLKPKLYLLAAGITHYKNHDQLDDLHFAAKDAQDFADAFHRQEGGLYQKVETKVLTDEKATATDIRDGLDWVKQQTTAKDVAVIFLSGHGENDEALRFFFCAHDYDKQHRLSTGVSMNDIQSTLQNISGKVLFFIDSCHAGNALGKLFAAKSTESQVDVTRLVNELAGAENGAIVFTSSTGRQLSLELREGNGAFTKAIVEGLDGKADLLRNGKITVSTLEAFVDERVKELTEGQQTPTVAKPQTVPDFPIALKR